MVGSASPEQGAERPLVALAVAGDKLAFEALVRAHGSAVRMFVRRMGAQPAVADDVAQDAFIAAWRGIGQLRAEACFEAWVKQIAARLYVKQWRKTSRDRPLEAAGEPWVGASDPSNFIDLDRALEALTPSERLCISLSIGAGYTHSDLVKALRMPLGTVKSHMRRGTEKLKARLSSGERP